MNKTAQEIYYRFQGKLVGTKRMKQLVCETLAEMPEEIMLFITENCWFISSLSDAYAFTFTGNDLKNQHLIFLSEDLLSQEVSQIFFSTAHEIGHVILKHRNAITEHQTKQEIAKQEREADNFAKENGFYPPIF